MGGMKSGGHDEAVPTLPGSSMIEVTLEVSGVLTHTGNSVVHSPIVTSFAWCPDWQAIRTTHYPTVILDQIRIRETILDIKTIL